MHVPRVLGINTIFPSISLFFSFLAFTHTIAFYSLNLFPFSLFLIFAEIIVISFEV
jgi:hypothetical protein